MNAPNSSSTRPKKRDVHGWLILDKPVGMTSTHAVALIKRVFRAKKAGHAGTLDPLASGCLPIALGEATKTVPYVMDGEKAYRFTVTWGTETTTDDTEGTATRTSALRPVRADVEKLLPCFTGAIQQVPPQFSAIKIDGERAYDLARDGETVALEAREVVIDRLTILEHSPEATILEAECGKGTYVRAIARDLGRALGCFGHVTALRRTRVGPFPEAVFVPAQELTRDIADPSEREAHLSALIAPVERGLDELSPVTVSTGEAGRLRRGQGIILRGRDAPVLEGHVAVFSGAELVAIGDMQGAELRPHRVFNFAG
jgi:tRNA pseudouridine55 synthase